MKTFKDLEFKSRPSALNSQAVMGFDNNYGVSVIIGQYTYGGSEGLYEIGILYKGSLTYYTHITDDVIGYCTEGKVTEVMEQVQNLID